MAILHFRCKERRRTVRVMLTVPLRVSGKTEIGERFSVKALSHSVSLHGASVEAEIASLLAEPRTAYLHVRNTEAGCFICEIAPG